MYGSVLMEKKMETVIMGSIAGRSKEEKKRAGLMRDPAV